MKRQQTSSFYKGISTVSFLVLLASSFWSEALAIEIPDRGFSETTPAAENFPQKGFSFESCSSKIPIKKKQNPWMRIEKKKTRQAPMNPDPPSWVESYFVTPQLKERRFSIVNQEDSIYNAPTTLSRIDCKNGLIYFQHLLREPVATNTYRVFDLLNGAEYRVTEGAVTFSPDGEHLLIASASDQGQKCGRSSACEIQIQFLNCKERKKKQAECKLEKEYTYQVSAKAGAAFFAPVPVKWKAHAQDLQVTLGGSRQSPAKIICHWSPQLQCKPSKQGPLNFQALSRREP